MDGSGHGFGQFATVCRLRFGVLTRVTTEAIRSSIIETAQTEYILIEDIVSKGIIVKPDNSQNITLL
jgi:hypothetical protein